MGLKRDTVAIPLSSGIKPSSRVRLLEATKLLTAQNCSFILDQGPQKRNGHVSHVVRTNLPYPGSAGITAPVAMPVRQNFSTANPQIPATWLYGWGIYSGESATGVNPYEVSIQPNVGQLFGTASRDNEVITWDGHRMFSYAPNQASLFGETQSGATATTPRGPSTMPALRAQPIAKIADAQLSPDAADNGTLRVAAWLNGDGVTGGYSVYDSSNKAALVSNSTLTFQAPKSLRCISVGPWFHILVSDTTANSLEMRSFHQDTPGSVISRSMGTVDIQFDIKKINESSWIIVKGKTGVITMFVQNADGTTKTTAVLPLGGLPLATNAPLAVEIDSNQNVGLVYESGVGPYSVVFKGFNLVGGLSLDIQTITTVTTPRRLTISPKVTRLSNKSSIWDVFVEDIVSSIAQVRSYSVSSDIVGSTSALTVTRHRVVLASHAFRVGNRNFVWCAPWLNGTLGLQTTWFLMDSALLPVGKLDYGQAAADLGATRNNLPSVNWHTDSADHPFKDRIVFHGALPYNQRVASVLVLGVNNNPTPALPSGIYTETSIRFYELDFLPKMRAGQAGRATYFAGAQLWAYDGAEVVEAGFHLAPEGITGVSSAGGSLAAGTYRYRVDLCHKNAQNEEIRSWSLVTAGITAAASDKITLTIPLMPITRREDAYFLIYRTAANGSLYFLANSRDPQSALFLKNNQTSATFTYVDTLSDATVLPQEYYPANAGGNYIDPLPAPACEIVAAGRDRLWLAGGELSPGEVAPSRLFFPGQSPAFSPALNIQIDRNAEPITAIGFVGDIAAIFRRTATYTIDSDGPDNSFNGQWAPPRLAVADTGAVGQEGLAITVIGLWFQSPAGLRLLNNSGAMDPQAGQDVDPITTNATFSAAVVVPQYTQVRWYSNTSSAPTIVLDYSSNSWSLWTGLTNVGAVFWPVNNLAVFATGDGFIFVESSSVFTDAGSPYEMIVRLAWLHAAQAGDYQRIRRVALFGNSASPLTLRARLYYDERPFFDEEIIRNYPAGDGANSSSTFNTSAWGGGISGGSWGIVGPWGDEDNRSLQLGSGLWFRDGVFKFRIRPGRQKCSVFSIEFSDMGATNSGFEPVVVALELARKEGLDRIPT